MTSRDFCYWLQGHFEIGTEETLSPEQVSLIKKHLAMVFLHEIDPSFGKDNEALDEIHNPRPLDDLFGFKPNRDVRIKC